MICGTQKNKLDSPKDHKRPILILFFKMTSCLNGAFVLVDQPTRVMTWDPIQVAVNDMMIGFLGANSRMKREFSYTFREKQGEVNVSLTCLGILNLKIETNEISFCQVWLDFNFSIRN